MSKLFVRCLPKFAAAGQFTPLSSISTRLKSTSSSGSGSSKGKGWKPPRRNLPRNALPPKFDPGNGTLNPAIEKSLSDLSQRQSEAKFGLPNLTEAECQRRVIFAETMLTLIEKQPEVLDTILFTDEGNFWPEKPNVYIGGNEEGTLNKKRYFKSKTYKESRPLPTICWCGMSSKEVVGPYFFNSHVTERSYQTMLQTFVIPQLKSQNLLDTIWFQQDGAPWHRSKKVLDYLKNTFGERLISYGTPLAWPTKSQDLTPLDYFLWDHLKTRLKVYSPSNHENLRECIAFEVETIDTELLNHFVRIQFRDRLNKCVEANGKRFQ